ncbi:DUF6463 family protein [Streptomyces sp. JJ38]|uniref:DUF6463 family protein n=1 Tax=Streptomyces sp. JJ38 TaxID=2738128 RepID=UPI001C55EE84|nr:DUF6463 family protein [Streptomyces sp. JJ38]MBW1597059.1 hypothetical protein [Streptomyces sp. JJ38]
MLRQSPGRWLQIIGVAHTAIGIPLYGAELRGIVRDGIVDTVPDHGERAAAFWYLTAGPGMWLAGRLLRSAERSDDVAAQRVAGGFVAATGAAGALLMPRSGFWALAAVGATAFRRAGHR